MGAAADEQGFDTSVPGVPDAEWTHWLSGTAFWEPREGPIVVVSPHPDDETLGCGGLMATCATYQRLPTLICITDGEAACPELPDLASVRHRELVGALRELGCANADIVRLALPDGGVACRELELSQWIIDRLPIRATLVAPCEFDGHPDHDAAGRACRRAAQLRDAVLARYPIWAWHRGASELLKEERVVRFALSAEAQSAKQRAIAQYRSQLDDRPGGAIVPHHVLEYFSRPYEVFLL